MFIAIKTDDGRIKGKISFYCRALHVSRQAFNKYLKTKATPWKYQPLADAMVAICREDKCNDTYGRIRMYQALQLKQPEGVDIAILSARRSLSSSFLPLWEKSSGSSSYCGAARKRQTRRLPPIRWSLHRWRPRLKNRLIR